VVTFEDPETSDQFEVDTSSARLRARFREKAAKQRRQIAEDVLRGGANMLEFSTDQPLLPQLVAHLRRTGSERRLPARRRSA
jgi:uncharacterized protein (DUF58 family)